MISISVIIPVYNREKYLDECLESVCKQKLADIEVLCIDDGSTDHSFEILQGYSDKYRFIKVFKQAHLGVSAARNLGIKKANGIYIAFLDSDDYYPDAGALEALYIYAVKKQVSICGGEICAYSNGKRWRTRSQSLMKGIFEFSVNQFLGGFSRFIYKTKFLRENGIFFPNYIISEDLVFLLKTLILAGQYAKIPRIVYCYRVNYKKRSYPLDLVIDALKGYSDIVQVAKKNQLFEVQKRIIYNIGVLPFYKYIIRKDNIVCNLYKNILQNLTIDVKYYSQYMLSQDQILQVYQKPNCYEIEEQELEKKLHQFQYCFIYGNGYIAKFVIPYITNILKVDIRNIVVSKGYVVEPRIENIPVIEIEQIPNDIDFKKAILIIAAMPGVQGTMYRMAKEKGFDNIEVLNFSRVQCYPRMVKMAIYSVN